MMKRQSLLRSSVVAILPILAMVLLAPPILAAGNTPAIRALFASARAPEAGVLAEHRGAETIRSRYVALAEGITEETRLITLNLFDDVGITALREGVEILGPGKFNWTGRLLGIERGSVILAVDGPALSGNITFPSAFYQIRTVGPALYGVYQIDQSKFPQEAEPRAVSLPPPVPQAGPDVASGDDGSMIDVLVVYTQAAASASANIESEIQLAIAETNQSYLNSGINQRARLAHSAQVTYSESGSFCGSGINDLDRLRNSSDGYLDDVPPMRNQYCADEVVLLVETGDACGCAYYMSSPSSSFESSAYAVVMRSCATGYYSFGHEMGHNMGAAHDWYMTGSDPPSSYNHGYVDAPHLWRTVMAYNNQCSDAGSSCTRLQYWSNPSLTYNGAPLGVSQGSYHAADNHSTLNGSAFIVSNFRNSGSCSGPSGKTVNLTWSPPSSGGVNPPTNLQATPQRTAKEAAVYETEPNGCITLVGGSNAYQTVYPGDTVYGSVEPSDTGGCIHFTNSSDYWEDLYAFVVNTSSTYTFSLSWPGGQDLDLLLLTPGMSVLNPACGNTYCGYTCSNPETFSVNLSPGTYVLAVNLASGTTACASPSTVSYTITVSGGPSGPTLLGYDLYRATTDSDPYYSKINASTVAASATAFTDTVAPEGTLYYRAKALYDQGTSGWSNTAMANTNPVTPPTVTWMTKRGSPFRIECSGSDLQAGIRVYINGAQWSGVVFGSSTSTTLTGGQALKRLVPKNVTTLFRFVNPDGGERSYTWHWP